MNSLNHGFALVIQKGNPEGRLFSLLLVCGPVNGWRVAQLVPGSLGGGIMEEEKII